MIEPNNPISERVAADGYETPRRPVKVQKISITRRKHGNQVSAEQTNLRRRLRAKPRVLGGGSGVFNHSAADLVQTPRASATR